MSNYMFENPYFIIIGYYSSENYQKLKFDFKKNEWIEEDIEF